MGVDTSPDYWDVYTNLQHTKHALIREYLNGWFPKLGLWSGRIVYLDTHAGRGIHGSGERGSPLVALETLLNHSFRNQILEKSEVKFLFVEHDQSNVAVLESQIAALGTLPSRVQVTVTAADCYEQIHRVLDALERSGEDIAPAFVFVDPYGFKVPGALLARLLLRGRVELFVNVIWRELDMAMAQARSDPKGGMASTLDTVFDGTRWREIERPRTVDRRADMTIDLLRCTYRARWATSIRMLGENGTTRYLLAHFTNHEAGRDLMKDCVWKVCPGGGCYARRSDNPNQARLITPEPDLTQLRQWLLERLAQRAWRWSELTSELRKELWRPQHLATVIRSGRKSGELVASDFTGRFSQSADPVLRLRSES